MAFDEAQFFDAGLIEIIERLANSGVRVIVAGLDQDFRGNPFGIMPELMARAEYVTKLQGICMVCGDPATRTQRLINGHPADYDDPTILVSASEKYESRCRHCHQVPHRAYENKDDNYYMSLALKEASKAYLEDEVPVGAVLVVGDKVIAKAHNERQKSMMF